MQHNVPYLKMR